VVPPRLEAYRVEELELEELEEAVKINKRRWRRKTNRGGLL